MTDMANDLDLDQDESIPETVVPDEARPIKTSTNTEQDKLEALGKAIDPATIVREQRVAGPPGTPFENFDETFKQRKLSSFPRLEFTALMTRTLKSAAAGQEGSSISSLLSSEGGFSSMLSGDTSSVDMFINAILTIGSQAPDVVKECFMLSLGVPRAKWPIISEIWNMPAEEDGTGGLSDEDEQLMFNTFVDQNAEAIMDFYRETLPSLWRRGQTALNPTPDS